jgi:hypothetical protein
MDQNEPKPDRDRSVAVKLAASPDGLRRIADMLEEGGEGHTVRINWYTAQIEFIHCTDTHTLPSAEETMTSNDGNECSDYQQPKRVLPSSKTYSSVQEMLDDINPELAEEFRAHAKRPTVRLRKWWSLFRIRRTCPRPARR